MKILKAVVAVIIILIMIFLSLGMFSPTITYTNQILVNGTPEKCWTAFNDTTKMSQWMEGFESFKRIEGDSLAQGTLYELIIVQDKRMVMQERVLEVVKPTHASFELTNDVLKSNYSFDFIAQKDQTLITASYVVTGNNMFWKSVFVLMKSYFESGGNQQLEGLKKVIEAE